MKSILVIVGILAASTAVAQPSAPPTVELPSDLVVQTMQYLGARPFNEVEAIIGGIRGCVAIQVPQATGVTIDRGQCPAVSGALRDRSAKGAPDVAAPK